MKFIKLIKVENEFFSYIYNNEFKISDIKKAHKESKNVNLKFIVHWIDYLKKDHFTNISDILARNIIPNDIITIQDFIDKYLDDLLIYGYETNFINPINKLVRFANVDLFTSNITYKSYNISTSQEGEFFNDPNYPDLLIEVEGLSLDKKMIIFNNKVYNTHWYLDKAAVFHDKNISTYYNKFSFMDLNYSELVYNYQLKKMKFLDYFIIPSSPINLKNGFDFFVVFAGYPFFIKSKFIKRIDNKLYINWNYVLSLSQFENFTKNEILNHDQTFICFIKCNKLYYRIQNITKDMNNLYFANIQDKLNPGTYICLKDDNTIHNFTIVKPKFKSPITKETNPYQIFIDDEEVKNGISNNNFKLINMLIA